MSDSDCCISTEEAQSIVARYGLPAEEVPDLGLTLGMSHGIKAMKQITEVLIMAGRDRESAVKTTAALLHVIADSIDLTVEKKGV